MQVAAGFLQQKSRRIEGVMRNLRCAYAYRIGSTPVIKVYGLLRTGTNYLTKLIELNLDTFCMRSREHGWKHGRCEFDPNIHYVFMVKDPYSWLMSFMDWERIHERYEGDITTFLATPLTHAELAHEWNNTDVIDVWGQTLHSWLQVAEQNNVTFLRYEDVLASYSDALTGIADELGLSRRDTAFVNLEKRADDWKTPNPRVQRASNYYRDKHYLADYSSDDLALIASKLDKDLVEHFGYQIIGETR